METHSLKSSEFRIFNIGIDRLSMDEVVENIERWIRKKENRWLVTANPEILYRAYRDEAYAQVLRSSDLIIPDGIGLAYAERFIDEVTRLEKRNRVAVSDVERILIWIKVLWKGFVNRSYLYKNIKEIVSGDLLVGKLLEVADRNGWKVFLLGGSPGAARQAEKNILNSFKNITLMSHSGAKKIFGETNEERESVRKAIAIFSPEILLIAYGAPGQELWIHKNLRNLPVNVAIGVGGTIDELAGMVSPTPDWMRKLGLRWLWRLGVQPSRWNRILTAVVRFPIAVSSSAKDTYR